MATNEVEYHPKTKQGKFAGAKEFLYDPQTGAVAGRTCLSWAKIGLFYLVFYSCLAGFFAIWLAVFFTTVSSDVPKQKGMTSLLKDNPGMGYRPQPDVETTLIRFEQGKPESYEVYTDGLRSALELYENKEQDGENYIQCENIDNENRDKSKVCKFNVDLLGSECTWQKEFGYDEGQPCVLLKLNKIYEWVPEPYENGTVPDEAKEAGIGDRLDENHVGVTCQGENPADQENMGPIQFWPPMGFNKKYYPYLHQDGYRAPLVMVKFKKPKNGVIIQVWCKAWAENIYHHKNDKAGSIHFELMID